MFLLAPFNFNRQVEGIKIPCVEPARRTVAHGSPGVKLPHDVRQEQVLYGEGELICANIIAVADGPDVAV